MNCQYFPEQPSVVPISLWKASSTYCRCFPSIKNFVHRYSPQDFILHQTSTPPTSPKMSAKSFLELVGVSPSKATVENSTLVIIDAQNEYIFPNFLPSASRKSLTSYPTRYVDGHLKTVNVASTRASIASLLDKYRAKADPSQIVHIVHATPEGAPVFTPKSMCDFYAQSY
jgi:hypothetical protein